VRIRWEGRTEIIALACSCVIALSEGFARCAQNPSLRLKNRCAQDVSYLGMGFGDGAAETQTALPPDRRSGTLRISRCSAPSPRAMSLDSGRLSLWALRSLLCSLLCSLHRSVHCSVHSTVKYSEDSMY
jgi:hypothetical protein